MRETIRRFVGCLLFAGLLFQFFPGEEASGDEPIWNKIERGLLYARLETETLVREEKSVVHIYNIDTARYGFRIFHCQDFPEKKPLSFEEWYQKTDAPILFNIGSSSTTGNHPGYFRVSGKTIQNQLYTAWKGMLAMDPLIGPSPSSRIIDLEFESFDAVDPGFNDALQQPMLLDEMGELRVEPRTYKATRMALAEDNSRNLLVFLTEKPCTLYELARWLKNSPLSLKRVMSVGGGNMPQALGRFSPERIYILEPEDSRASGQGKGSLLVDLSSKERLSWVMGPVPLRRR